MTIYLLELLIILLGAVIAYALPSGGRKAYLVLTFGGMFLISGLRDVSVGTDTMTYEMGFENIANSATYLEALDRVSMSAPIYTFYNWVISRLCNSGYQAVLAFNAAVISLCVGYLVFRMSESVVFSAYSFFAIAAFFQSMNGMREYVAVAVASVAYYLVAINRKRAVSGWLLLLCATGIHTTAIAMVAPILGHGFINSQKNKYKATIQLTVVVCLCALLMEPIIQIFVRIFPYYGMYFGTEKYDILRSDSSGRIVFLYLLLAVPVVMAVWEIKSKEADAPPVVLGYYPVVICAVVFGVVFARSFLMNRVLWFYLVAFIWFIPGVFSCFDGRKKALLYLIIGGGLAAWCFFQLSENKSDVVPYVLAIGNWV